MKLINKFAIIGLMACGFASCVDNDPEIQVFPNEAVDFTYNVEGDQYLTDYYVVSTIQFNNISAEKGTCTWNFGDGKILQSNDPVVTHKYDAAGSYNVTLTIDGVGERTYPLMIADIVPKLSITEQSSDMIVMNETTISFGLSLPNPEQLPVVYEWYFPEGTIDADGNELDPSEGYIGEEYLVKDAVPEQGVKFKHIGSQQVLVRTYFNAEGGDINKGRRLADTYINVQVAVTPELAAPNLYYATYKGNIKALKLVEPTLLPEGTKVFPYDMGVSAGEMPYQLCYGETAAVSADETQEAGVQGWVYILDAGKQYYYTGSPEGAGDGKITAMGVDGTNVNTVISSVGGHAFNDPFHGFVAGGRIYYTDRNTGVRYIDQTARGQQENATLAEGAYFVQNSWLGYYNKGIAYGAIHTGILQDSKGVWWWGKDYSGNGIYRFTAADINSSTTPAAAPNYSVLLSGIKLKAFTIDETRGALYVWRRESGLGGFYKYPLPAADTDALSMAAFDVQILADADAINTTADEGVYTTQFALDKTTGRVYFCYRPADGVTTAKVNEMVDGKAVAGKDVDVTSGIYYYDPETKTIAKFGETSDEGLGCVINPNPTQLF